MSMGCSHLASYDVCTVVAFSDCFLSVGTTKFVRMIEDKTPEVLVADVHCVKS